MGSYLLPLGAVLIWSVNTVVSKLAADSISAAALHKLRKSHRSNDRDYDDSCFLPHLHILCRISGSCRNNLHALFNNHLRHIIRIRAH